MIRLRRLVLLALALVIMAVPVLAQSDRGTITGNITDPGGASIAGAKVTATSLTTGDSRVAETSSEGNYTIPEIPAGAYKLTIEAEGFKAVAVDELQVAVQVSRRADFKLEVGSVSEVVTITDDPPAIQRDSAVRQTNVNERQVKELPLQVQAETAGRTPLSFIFLDSSVTASTSTTGGTNASNFKVNGGQGLGTDILIDGASTRRTQNGTFFSEVAPGPNAFQEFTISTSNYSAEFGSSSGGIVNFTLKSGGNDVHGEAYLLFRNEALNANSYFNNLQRSGLVNCQNSDSPECFGRPRDRQFDFGGNVGGPVRIPHIYNGKDRTFFFFNYEQYKFDRTESVLLTVPTPLMRTGDFSELLTDPYVLQFFGHGIQIYDPTMPAGDRVAIPGNRLDRYRGGAILDPAGLALVNQFPLPTLGGVYHNYQSFSDNPLDMHNYVGKIDHVLNENQRVAVSYSYRTEETFKGRDFNPGGFTRFPGPFISSSVWNQTFGSHFLRAQHDWTVSPTLLNHFNFGFTRIVVANLNPTEGKLKPTDFGIPENATQNRAAPILGFPGYGDPASSPDPRAYNPIGSTFFSDNLKDNTFQFTDLVTWVTGNHTFKFGADVRYNRFDVHQLIHPGGEFNFRANQTASNADPGGGWPVASLVTGATEFAFATVNSIDPGWRQITPAFFVNDDWKITSRLTLNLGLRYDIPYGRTEVQDRFRTFDPTAPNPEVGGRAGALVGAGGQGGLQAINRRLIETDRSNLAPRLGAAYSINDRTVVRGGFGLYYAPLLFGTDGGGDLNNGTIGYTASRVYPNFDQNAGTFLSRFPAAPLVNPEGQFLNGDVPFYNQDFRTGRTMQWSLDVQRELPANFVVSAGYIGNKGERLRSNFGRINALPLDALKLGATILRKNVNDLSPAERRYAESVGFSLPANGGSVFEGFNGNVAQALRPFPQYNNINSQLESKGESWYNALQLKLDRRFAQGVQFGASYTWSKLLTNASEDVQGGSPNAGILQNPYDIKSLKSLSVNDVPHVFVANFLVELPFGSGRAFMDRHDWVDKVVGGWQIGGILRYQAGTPILVQYNGATSFLGLVGFNGNLRPNLTGQPFLVPNGNGYNGGSFGYLNPAAFAPPPAFEGAGVPTDPSSAAYAAYYADPTRFFGSASPVSGDLRFLGYKNEDFSILKKTRITETVTFEIGAEFFNAFNRHRYFGPANDIGNTAGFGQSSVDPNAIPRIIQLRGRVIF